MPYFIFFLYRSLQVLGYPLLLLYLLRRITRDLRYRSGLRERFGYLPQSMEATAPGNIWLHAVSVGEVISAIELFERLRRRLPSARLYVSVTTLAGRAMADQKLGGVADGVFYTPLDYAAPVRRVLRTIKPSLLIVMETEIWPNLYREAKRYGCGLLVVNGRISDKAFPRYRRWRWFFGPVLALPDLILAHTAEIRRRYLEAGAPPEKVAIGGNLKYDFDPGRAAAPAAVKEFVRKLSPAQVWIAASTMPPETPDDPDEDDIVIQAFRALPEPLLILAPRRPERFDSAAEKLAAAGVQFVRRSALTGEEPFALPGVLLLDSIGELGGIFPLADVVFMGGTLVHRGGHNILEPAFFSKPVIAGPHMENFADIAAEFTAGGGLVRIGEPGELAPAVARLLSDEAERRRIGERAHELAQAKSGATDRAVEEAVRIVEANPGMRGGSPLLAPLAWLWEKGSARKRKRQLARAEGLPCRVVSVGGISMGGTGKTPFVLWLAQQLKARGVQPAIVTRGYRRRQPEKYTLIGPGDSAGPARTGDEAQIFVGAGVGPVGIGKDRLQTGRLLLDRYPTDVVLLDDGFQHWRLRRDVDIVLVDSLDPFAGGHTFPRGRLRESLDALDRAHAFVITRAEPGRSYEGIVAVLRRYNAGAPVFRARVKPIAWVDAESGEELRPEAPAGPNAAAFCGLGNPAAFHRTLAELGIRPAYCWAFDDHHHYRPGELRRLASQARHAGAGMLLTTEKDLANLDLAPKGWAEPLRLLWLKIGVEVDEPEKLIELAGFPGHWRPSPS